MSNITYDGYKSARAHLYCVSNTVMPDVVAKKYHNSLVLLRE